MKLRLILTVLSLLAFLSVCTTGYLYYSSLRDEAFNEANKQAALHAERAKNHISYLLSENLKTVTVLAGLQELQEALNKEDPSSLAKANSILDHFNESLKVDVCYLMNRDGNTLATSNRNAPDSFLGKNYAFRPYFQQSIKGAPAIYMALGVTSKKRGAYYSHPIYGENKKSPIGVAVIKASIDPIEKDLKEERESTALLIDPQGVIFLSNRDDWLFQALWDLPPEKLSQIAQTKQFGEGPFYWTGLQKKEGAGAIDHSGNKYLIRQMELDNYPGWNIVFLRSLRSVAEDVSNQLMRKTGPFVWVLCVLIAFLVFYLYRKASHEIIQRKTAENALRESEERFRKFADEASFDGIIIHEEGNILDVNEIFSKMYGYKRHELLGMDALDTVTPEARDVVRQHIREKYEKPYQTTGLRKDGSAFPMEIRGKTIPYQGRKARVASIRDITERKRAEEEKEKLQSQL